MRQRMRKAVRDERWARWHCPQPPANATPPGTALAAMPNPASSCTSCGSRPRGQLAKKFSERLEDNDQHRGEEDQHREFVEPAEPDMALRVAVGGEVAQQHPAPQVIRGEQCAERHLDEQPAWRFSYGAAK